MKSAYLAKAMPKSVFPVPHPTLCLACTWPLVCCVQSYPHDASPPSLVDPQLFTFCLLSEAFSDHAMDSLASVEIEIIIPVSLSRCLFFSKALWLSDILHILLAYLLRGQGSVCSLLRSRAWHVVGARWGRNKKLVKYGSEAVAETKVTE